jgi:hypothetical protein
MHHTACKSGAVPYREKPPKGPRYVAPNSSSIPFNSALGLPYTENRLQSTMPTNRPPNCLSNVRKCATAAAESAYHS